MTEINAIIDFKTYMKSTVDDKFQIFINNLFPTNRSPKYWVNWQKAYHFDASTEIKLNTLNYLVGKRDQVETLAYNLFKDNPELLQLVPLLIATRYAEIDVLATSLSPEELSYYTADGYFDFNFNNPDPADFDQYFNFIKDSGLLEFIGYHVDRSLIDYVQGVNVGLDSNARKNRGGKQNEMMLENTMIEMLQGTNWKCQTQATGHFVESTWGITVPEVLKAGSKGGRRYDGAIYNPDRNEVTIIETNFYGGGGSKLKAVAGEFSSIYETSLRDAPHINFVWISDGKGWHTAVNPMREAFDVIPTIFNWRMIQQGYLKELITNGMPD